MMINNTINWFDRTKCIPSKNDLIRKKEEINISKAFTKYSNDVNAIFKNIEEYSKFKILIVWLLIFLATKKPNP